MVGSGQQTISRLFSFIKMQVARIRTRTALRRTTRERYTTSNRATVSTKHQYTGWAKKVYPILISRGLLVWPTLYTASCYPGTVVTNFLLTA